MKQKTTYHQYFATVILVVIQLLSTPLFSQQLCKNQEHIIRDIITRYLGAEANLRVLNNGKLSFLTVGNDTLFNIHGLRYVFKLHGDSVTRLDQSVYHGSNFYRYLFEYEGKMLALGGYGMFVTNHNLEAFSPESHEWYLIETHGDIPQGIKGTGVRLGDTVYIFNNCLEGNNINITAPDKYFYSLDLKTMTWKQHHEFRPEFLSTAVYDFFYLKDYIVAKGVNHSFVYNLKTREYLFHDNDALGIRSFNGYNTEVDQNKLLITIKDTFQFVYKDTLRDIEDLWVEYKKLAKPLVLSTPIWFTIQPYLLPSFLLITLGLIILWAIWKWRRPAISKAVSNPIIQKILLHPESVITLDTLDKLLEIDYMEGESKKTKRHRLMATIESSHPGLIERRKDETDKRRFVYYIHK